MTELTPSELREYITRTIQSTRPHYVNTYSETLAEIFEAADGVPWSKLDEIFKARTRDPNDLTTYVDPTEVWTQNARCPEGIKRVRVDSIPLTRYGNISVFFRDGLPDPEPYTTATNEASFEWGFEQGAVGAHDNISFGVKSPAGGGSRSLNAHVGMTDYTYVYAWIGDIVTNPWSDQHVYQIILSKNMVEFTVDKELKALFVPGPRQLGRVTASNTPPYVVAVPRQPLHAGSNFRWTLYSDPDVEAELSFPPANIFWVQGAELPTRCYDLYQWETDSRLTSGTFDAEVTSHPFPLAGFNSKTILFRADTASTTDGLTIEVYTTAGNWRTYDTVTTTANELETYTITGNALLGRIKYDPSATGASITDAEVILR